MSRRINNSNKRHDYKKENMGFPLPRDDLGRKYYDQWERFNSMKINRQRARYKKLFQSWDSPTKNIKKLKKLVRKGVPPEYRGEVWFLVSGGQEKMKKNKGLYDKLVKDAKDTIAKSEEGSSDTKIINRMKHIDYIQNDINRTFPELPFFQDKKNVEILFEILCAFSLHKPKIGYCQGLNFVSGIFLYMMENPEQAFWTLDSCLEKYLPHDLYDPTMKGVIRESFVLQCLTKSRKKKVYNTLSKLGFADDEYAMFSTGWILTLFLNILPPETSLRVMDSFILEGSKVLFRISLAILDDVEKSLSQQVNFDKGRALSFLKNHCSLIHDCRKLMKSCFKIRNFSMKEVEKYRKLFEGKK